VHLSTRSYLILALTAALAIAGLWSGDQLLVALWRWPLALWLLAVALESLWIRQLRLVAQVECAARAFLGRAHAVCFAFQNPSRRPVRLEYAPATPLGFERLEATRLLIIAPQDVARDCLALEPVRLGIQIWPDLPARVLGRFGLIWWSRPQTVSRRISVAPDVVSDARQRPEGATGGARPRRASGAGAELHQLRAYVPGDPLARIDWKASARSGSLISREFSEDQHLDVMVAVDAGRSSRVQAGALDRLSLYANVAARFAATVARTDDRVGLIVYSDRVLAVSALERGRTALVRVTRALEAVTASLAESDPLAAAIRIRALLTRRSLVLLLTDVDDVSAAESLARAVRLLSPPHLVVAAGVVNPELDELARAPAREWGDAWIALAAQERERSASRHRELLRRLGAPVIAARQERLEQAVLDEYQFLRRARRI